MPIGGVNVGECPTNPGKAETAANLGIFINVMVVIVINEIVGEGLSENNPCDDG
jgi:hypothetical protein